MNFVQQQDVQQILAGLGPLVERFANKSVIISGGLGFLGRYFTACFEAMNAGPLQGREMTLWIVDTMIASGGAEPPKGSRHVQFFRKDIADMRDPHGGVDFILHCAGIASPAHYQKYPLETIEAALSVRSVLEIARRCDGCRVAFFSSSEIYGDPDPRHVPTMESYNGNVSPLGARACYDESKRLGETFVRVYQSKFGVPGVIIRPFNFYGPGMQPTDYRVLPNFAAHIVRGEPVKAYGSGRQTRTYCYVTDGIEGSLRALLEGVPGEPYNIGNPQPEISVLQLAQTIGRVLRQDVKVDVVEHPSTYPADEPQRRCPDIAKARAQLGYEPRVALEDGLGRFFAWAREEYPR